MHPFSTTRLVLGLLFLGIAGLWLADQVDWISDSSYLFPVLLILVGLISLLAFALRGVTQRHQARRDDLGTPTSTTDTDSDTDTGQEALR